MTDVAAENLEAQQAWDGVLFDRFLRFRDIVIPGLTVFSEEALRVFPPNVGDRVLDVGCGFGDTARRLASWSALPVRCWASTSRRGSSSRRVRRQTSRVSRTFVFRSAMCS
jgi:hypothetical protein